MGYKLTQEQVIEKVNKVFNNNVELVSIYKNKRESITLKCKQCGHIWSTTAANILYADSKQCPNCKEIERINSGQFVKCAYCGKEIFRYNSRIENNKTGLFYCSRECGNKHKNLLRFNAGEWSNSKNYRAQAFFKYEHKCEICDWNEDEDFLEVHHIDENRENNNLDNLIILCPLCHKKLTTHKYKLIDRKMYLNN